MTQPTTKTDWLLSVVGLSFFGGIFFGPWGLTVGPAYFLLSVLIQMLVARQESCALLLRIQKREIEFQKILIKVVGHAKNEPCTCKKLCQFTNEKCQWESWEKSDPQQLLGRVRRR